ncbi:extensin-like [Pteropus medius]|uniref:extensin-like n=1 Tax=Pteropus vampyrus TaxID=132908 RepID=UPI00196B8FD8|nr:extensin-like [Pteropus giganteus]XP_039730738.1 extensin-like [Pteropus giganteus]
MEAGRAHPSPTAPTVLPNSGYPTGVRSVSAATARSLPTALLLQRPAGPHRTPSGRTRSPEDPACPQRSPQPPPLPATAWAARTLDRNSPVAVTGDSSPKSHLPLPTHRCAPSCVPDADVRSTLTAAAAAAAERWNSPTPSPTARGRRAKPPLQPL